MAGGLVGPAAHIAEFACVEQADAAVELCGDGAAAEFQGNVAHAGGDLRVVGTPAWHER